MSLNLNNIDIDFDFQDNSIGNGSGSVSDYGSNKKACLTGFNPYSFGNPRKRGCSGNNSNSFWNIYQKQKIIQKTVRVPSSLYTMNLGGLSVYQHPDIKYQNVNWNQMSDRKEPHYQKTYIPTQKSTKHSYTSNKPGCQSPGGIGVDIKHNSYARYLNRLKGKGPLRRGIITTIDITKIPFNPAFPIYGGKTFKTSIVNNCNCPIVDDIQQSINFEKILFSSSNQQNIFDVKYTFMLVKK